MQMSSIEFLFLSNGVCRFQQDFLYSVLYGLLVFSFWYTYLSDFRWRLVLSFRGDVLGGDEFFLVKLFLGVSYK